ncbi:hypothetical protein GCM10009760_58520 [Kitasatospora kazusensis]|uniref:Uncharacterized protein n=1 Tax=Kitasatospora kazusensis TaxID=407974 RepID=A0ABN3A9R1_9ACTN
MDDEPLSEWAQRRTRRLRPVGTRRVVTTAAAHIDATAPRLIQEWDGHAWVAVALTDEPPTTAVATGSGRHRRP